jgi:hypothetical protein
MYFGEAAHQEFAQHIFNMTTRYTDLSRLYRLLKNGQFHFEPRHEFVVFHQQTFEQHTCYVETYRAIATKFECGISTQPMISVGLQHADALRICREIASMYGFEFNLTTYITASRVLEEEGEVEEDVFTNVQNMQSDTFLADAFSYIRVAIMT